MLRVRPFSPSQPIVMAHCGHLSLEVVEDARQNFAASISTPLPPLPISPVARHSQIMPGSPENYSSRSSRIPRRILPANQIFVDDYDTNHADQSAVVSLSQEEAPVKRRSVIDLSIPVVLSENSATPQETTEAPTTPIQTRVRRATIVTRSPEVDGRRPSLEVDTDTQREKSKSQHDLGRSITPVNKLELELEQCQFLLVVYV